MGTASDGSSSGKAAYGFRAEPPVLCSLKWGYGGLLTCEVSANRKRAGRRRKCPAAAPMLVEEHTTETSRWGCGARGFEWACQSCITPAPSREIYNVVYPTQSPRGGRFLASVDIQ